ncbi:methyltransferase [Sphaerisporangium sp. TRM90804]|uniref:methyltransferase n=1 Tax=Sphaerisporangium sp. TRM90804 TaxID=3031113 RepID=UPI00244CC084|nr:methyltransferase [Sphaerisporangium sp. TRM90804]MDH2429451.1 methyltransferase [Sphaerisporangium sp. TRM90804]
MTSAEGGRGERGRASAWEAAWEVLAPVTDLVTPMAVRVAASLGLSDLMGDDVVSVEELARRSVTDVDALGRVLRHLVCHGVFVEPEPGRFAVNEPAALLAAGHPSGMRARLDLDGFGGRMDLAFTGLLHTVRTGEPAWETVFGAPFWRYLALNSQISGSFDAMMADGADYVADAAEGYDWSGARHVVDVGGGAGALLAEVLRANPGVRATLVDLPDTVERGRRYLAERGLETRCEFAGQSFFEPLPTGGDVYVLRRVLHDWGDDDARWVLRRCAEAAGRHGRVVVIETPGGSGDDPAMFAEMNLRMLVLSGGRERAAEDYVAIATEAGLDVAGVHTTPLGHVILDCTPPGD